LSLPSSLLPLPSPPLSAEDERSFLIDASLNFRPSSFEGDPSFAWKDIDYDDDDEESDVDEGELFEFVVDSKQVDQHTLKTFEETMLKCMFERVSPGSLPFIWWCRADLLVRSTSRNSTEVTIQRPELISRTSSTSERLPSLPLLSRENLTLEPFSLRPPRHPLKSLSQSQPDTPSKPTQANSNSLADSFNALSVSSNSTPTSKPAVSSSSSKEKSPVKTPVAKQEPASPAPAPVELAAPIVEEQVVAIIADERDEEELVVVDEAKAEIYLFDVEVEHFVLQGEVKITLIEKDAKTFDCELFLSFCPLACRSWSSFLFYLHEQTGSLATWSSRSSGSSVSRSTLR